MVPKLQKKARGVERYDSNDEIVLQEISAFDNHSKPCVSEGMKQFGKHRTKGLISSILTKTYVEYWLLEKFRGH